MPTPDYHAKLGPSASHRWVNCPASITLSTDAAAPKTSEYAEAGRLAHEIAELKARKRFMVMAKRTFTSQLKKLQSDERYKPEMDGYTDLYVEVLEQHAMSFANTPFIALESSVPIGLYTGETKEDGSPATGTADCIQIAEGVLWVTDYKNGAGVPVDATENSQMMMYALGALAMYAPIYGDTIQQIKMTIVQPALRSVSNWEISRADLEAWAQAVLVPAATKAVSDDPGEPNPGDWCRFCPARYRCRARANKALALEAFGGRLPEGAKGAENAPGPMMTDAEVADALARGEQLVSWYNSLKDYALQACLAGKDIPGYKAVAGRSTRDWDDLDEAFAALQERGVDPAFLWERKPVTVAALEKALGKKAFAELADGHVIVQPGKPTLVSAEDKRPPYNAAQIAFGGSCGAP